MSGPAATWSALTSRGRVVGLLALALLAGGVGWRYPVLAGLGGCLLALVLAELVVALTSPGVTVQRVVAPQVVVRHDPCQATLRLSGRVSRLVHVEAADHVDGEVVPVPLRAGASTVDYPVPTPRRGMIPVGPLRVRRVARWGTAATTAEVGQVTWVRVLPRRVPVDPMSLGHRRTVVGGDDSLEHGGTDLVGLHEYVMGDDLRRLHWATSARTGTLMVREDAEPSEPHVCVLLDDRADSYDSDTGPASGTASGTASGSAVSHGRQPAQFEEAVELAAALCRVTTEAGHPLRFATCSGRHSVTVPGSRTRTPTREAGELEWLLAEITVTEVVDQPHGLVNLDVAVAVTGPHADLPSLATDLRDAQTGLAAVVDPRPLVAAGSEAGLLVIRGASSTALAQQWGLVMGR